MLEQRLLQSAAITGAATDPDDITGKALALAPTLMQVIPYDEMGEVWRLVALRLATDPEQQAVLANARDFFAAWYQIVSRREAEAAQEHERRMREYREQAQADLSRNPRQVHHISDLAERDGVLLPWKVAKPAPATPNGHAPGATESHAKASPGDGQYPDTRNPSQADTEAQAQARLERISRNRAAWYALARDHEIENRSVDGTVEGEDTSGRRGTAPRPATGGRKRRTPSAKGGGRGVGRA